MKGTYDITKMGELKSIRAEHRVFRVRTVTKNFGRQIVVTEGRHHPEEKKLPMQKLGDPSAPKEEEKREMQSHNREDVNIKVTLQGFGVSVMDGEPKELLYLSLYEVSLELEKNVKIEAEHKDATYYLSVNVGHVQVDNMLEKSFPVIFGPQRLFVSKKEREANWGPFIQVKVMFTESREEDLTFDSVQLQLSEMGVFVDQEIAMSLAKVAMSIAKNFKTEHLSLTSGENKTDKPLELGPIYADFKALEPSLPEELPISVLGGDRMFIELMDLAAIKVRLTLRLEKTAVDPTGPLAVVQVLYSFVAAVSNISDAPVYFREMLFKNTFVSPRSLISELQKNYLRQAVLQVYRVLAAIDIIGNPIGFIDRLGSGVFEFFNEPRKGIMKGPKEFAEGIGKGFRSLVTNVVGAGLDSVSRVTGSLYSLVK